MADNAPIILAIDQGSGSTKALAIDTSGIIVNYFDEFSIYHEEKCIGLWENKTQYKLTWKTNKTVILEKVNLSAVKYYHKNKE
jgi:sugar (pentulose or hexulose) kinase